MRADDDLLIGLSLLRHDDIFADNGGFYVCAVCGFHVFAPFAVIEFSVRLIALDGGESVLFRVGSEFDGLEFDVRILAVAGLDEIPYDPLLRELEIFPVDAVAVAQDGIDVFEFLVALLAVIRGQGVGGGRFGLGGSQRVELIGQFLFISGDGLFQFRDFGLEFGQFVFHGSGIRTACGHAEEQADDEYGGDEQFFECLH